MTTKRFWLGLLLVVVLGGVVLIVAAGLFAPEVSTVMEQACLTGAEGDDCIRFPMVSGLSLSGVEVTLPDDFDGDYTLVVVPFDDDQQLLAETWLRPVQALAAQYPGLTYYDAAVMPDLAPAVRVVVRVGLNALITDPHLRDVTVTLFLRDRDLFLDALDIPDFDLIQVFLLNRSREVIWRGSGEYTVKQGDSLIALLDQLPAQAE
ncbi:MAG: hypothetical protein H6672_12155 [Anaerolineaceae bacterium]|nr:hypothetical protein [Anaerolineaceae bacterium]